MKISFSKNNIIQFLLLLIILLLAVNIILERLYQPDFSAGVKTLPSSDINDRFLSSLKNYNMDSSWISHKKVTSKDGDSLKYNYKVNIPPDLPASLLIREIQNQFDTSEVDIESVEFRKDNSTELTISSGGYERLKALMTYDKEIKRNTDTIGFVLTGIAELNKDELNSLLLMPEHFTGVLIPSKQSQELLRILRENQKEAAVLLNDDISELEFKLNTGYSSRRIKNSIISILGKFQKAAFFIIDESSDIYKSSHYKLISEEFSKRKITLWKWGRFTELKNTSGKNLNTEIRSVKNNKIIRLTSGEFLEMPPMLAELRKTGYKFVSPSVLIEQAQESK